MSDRMTERRKSMKIRGYSLTELPEDQLQDALSKGIGHVEAMIEELRQRGADMTSFSDQQLQDARRAALKIGERTTREMQFRVMESKR